MFIILFLHQTTTKYNIIRPNNSCLSSCSYIKPQLGGLGLLNGLCCLSSCSYIKPQLPIYSEYRTKVVYHLVPTSNHNQQMYSVSRNMLFIILFLHQTTTCSRSTSKFSMLFIILFLHQTTTATQQNDWNLGCLSSCSYIKPQR